MKHRFSRKREIVLLDMAQNHYQLPYLCAVAREKDWHFLDLSATSGAIPEGFDIKGAIISSLPSSSLGQQLIQMQCPAVRIGRAPHPLDHRLPAVITDLYGGGVMAADHFCSRGFEHIGYIGHETWREGKRLYDGLNERTSALGSQTHLLQQPQIPEPQNSSDIDLINKERVDYSNRIIRDWLKTVPKPIGIFAYGYKLASRIDLICQSLSISVPGEVSILCYRNMPGCEVAFTPISSIDIGLHTLAQNAVDLLQSLMDGNPPPAPQIIVPPSRIILRQSTDILAVADPGVTRAISFIWEHLQWPITVQDVAEEAGVPHRTLARNFKKCLGRSINEELRRKRLERGSELLRESTMPVSQITKAVGFNSKAYFHKSFLEEYGLTPNEFRTRATKKSL